MSKTLIIVDSASDITIERERELGVKVLNIPIAVDGKPYRDRIEIDGNDFCEKLAGNAFKELPTSSQITVFEYHEAYLEAARDGYDSIITVCINGKGSGCYSAAGHAVETLRAENPEAADKLKIHVVDGGSYTIAVSWPIERAVKMLEQGETAENTANWLRDLYDNQVTLIGLTQLKYPKLSGRLNSSAAIIGDALGIKPVLSIYEGENTVADKVRGEKNLIPKIVELYLKFAENPKGDYSIAYGSDKALGDELAQAMENVTGNPPVLSLRIGPVIALNSGPRMVGMVFRRKKGL